MLIAACKCGRSAPRDGYALVTPSLDGNAALTAKYAHSSMQVRLHAARQLCARHAISRWGYCVVSNSTLSAACKCGYSTPRDSYALVTPSLDGNDALAATACSLEHASAATARCVAAMCSSRHLSMAMLRSQQQHARCSRQVQLQYAARQLCARRGTCRW